MTRLARVLAALFPSVPPRDQAIVLAAMEGRDLETPVVERLGEERDMTGQSEGGDERPNSFSSSPLSGAPAVENLRNWRAHPSHRWEFTDRHLEAVLNQWGATS